jgi:uncharacterized membrane protein
MENAMSEFVVIAFEDPMEADRALTQLTRLQKEYLVDLEDAVVAIRAPDGQVRIKQSVNIVGAGAVASGASGALFGSLVGLLFLNPLAGMVLGGAIGAGSGALAGSLTDYGINDDLIREIANTIKPDSSALFLLVRKAQPEKVLAEFKDYKGRIIRSSLSPEQESKLQQALAGQVASPMSPSASSPASL